MCIVQATDDRVFFFFSFHRQRSLSSCSDESFIEFTASSPGESPVINCDRSKKKPGTPLEVGVAVVGDVDSDDDDDADSDDESNGDNDDEDWDEIDQTNVDDDEFNQRMLVRQDFYIFFLGSAGLNTVQPMFSLKGSMQTASGSIPIVLKVW
jgi:hypothetical protein